MKNITGICLTILFLLLLCSCSVSIEKRRYRPGYHVEVVKNQPRMVDKPEGSRPINVMQRKMEIPVVSAFNHKDPALVETNLKQEEPVAVTRHEANKRERKKRDTDSCDVIFTAIGERIQARIIEITEEYVHYKRCDDPKGRLYSLKTKMIDNITLRNGELYIPPNRVIVDKEVERKKSQTLFVMSIISLSIAFIAFVFSFFITPFGTIGFVLSILSGIFSFILALLDIRPGKYVPSYRTKLTWIFYLIVLLLVIGTLIVSFL